MRVIKFRAWDKINKRIAHDHFWVDSDGNAWYDCDPMGIDISGKKKILCVGSKLELMQFTGLHDKHGNEIYEGDILKRSKELEPSFVAVIEFKNGMFGGTTKPYNNHFIEMPRLNKCDYGGGGYDEIIGNIYEHPSLLNQ